MTKIITTGLCLLCSVPVIQAQTFDYCADLNADSSLNIADLTYWLRVFQGAEVMPPGKGDIDFRQGQTLGDYRYFVGYIFTGYPKGGCPPFSDYETQTTSDSIIFPIVSIPNGDGELSAPIAFINHMEVTDILVPFLVTGLGTNVTLDSISSPLDQGTSTLTVMNTTTDQGLFLYTSLQGSLSPGRRVIARAHFSYQASSGGTLILSDDVPSAMVNLSYVYGDVGTSKYDDLEVGVPTMLISSEVPFSIPTMSATPDTLEFSYTDGDPDPAPQYIHVASNGASFDWTAQPTTSRYRVSSTTGVSGDSIRIEPRASTFNFGTTYNVLEIRSAGSVNSPVGIVLKMHVRPTYSANDADCDGDFDITDLIILVNYLFRKGNEPCDPFTTGP
jgi:hypothetical protein